MSDVRLTDDERELLAKALDGTPAGDYALRVATLLELAVERIIAGRAATDEEDR